jgi:hypothetical protein
VFHPLINAESGELELKTFKSNWKNSTSHMYQLLVYVKMLLNQLEIDTGLSGAVNNKEAAKLYDNDFEQFKLKVKETIDQCSQRVYDTPPINAYIPFGRNSTTWDSLAPTTIQLTAPKPTPSPCTISANT